MSRSKERRSSSRSRSRSPKGSGKTESGDREPVSKVKTEEDQSALTRFIKDKRTI